MPNGAIIVESGKSPTTFRLLQIKYTQKLAGLDGAIGSGLARLLSHLRQYRSFKKARAFVRGLGLKSQAEWSAYCKSGKKPDDIPANPDHIYAKTGWAGMGDWLGTGTVATYLRQYRSFKKARAFVRGLGLKSGAEWSALLQVRQKAR